MLYTTLQTGKEEKKMENFATIAETQFANLVKEKTSHVNMICTEHVTNHAFYTDKANHVNMICASYEQIPKREYGLLLRQMENWGIVAPKAIVKKYGVFLVKRAVNYTKATPNVKNPAGYMTYMLQQFKKDMEVAEPKKEIKTVNQLEEKREMNLKATTTPENESKKQKGKITLPNITKWQEAREFLFKLNEYDMTNDNVVEFVKKIKRQYNFA